MPAAVRVLRQEIRISVSLLALSFGNMECLRVSRLFPLPCPMDNCEGILSLYKSSAIFFVANIIVMFDRQYNIIVVMLLEILNDYKFRAANPSIFSPDFQGNFECSPERQSCFLLINNFIWNIT
jgi:hypothetical protein